MTFGGPPSTSGRGAGPRPARCVCKIGVVVVCGLAAGCLDGVVAVVDGAVVVWWLVWWMVWWLVWWWWCDGGCLLRTNRGCFRRSRYPH